MLTGHFVSRVGRIVSALSGAPRWCAALSAGTRPLREDRRCAAATANGRTPCRSHRERGVPSSGPSRIAQPRKAVRPGGAGTGRTFSHEPVGVIAKLGSAVGGNCEGQRGIAGDITPVGLGESCLRGGCSQCGGKAVGGWKRGNTADGSAADYVLVREPEANLATIPDGRSDEHVPLCPDVLRPASAARGARAFGSAIRWPCSPVRGRRASARRKAAHALAHGRS